MMTTTKNRRRRAGTSSFILLLLNLLSPDTHFGVVTTTATMIDMTIGPAAAYDIAQQKQQQHTQTNIEGEEQRQQPSSSSKQRALLSSDHNFCGIGFQDASTSCQHPCPSGSLEECPHGMLCYFNTPCDIKDLGPRPSRNPTPAPKLPTLSPLAQNDPKLSFFCGKDWSDASYRCAVWCPNADDGVCPFGQSCFGDTTCQKTNEPTNKPTKPQPTMSPSMRPTGPTGAPTVGMMVDQPSNHQFCG